MPVGRLHGLEREKRRHPRALGRYRTKNLGLPFAAPVEPPKEEDKTAMAEKPWVDTIDFTDFIAGRVWDVDVALKPVYEGASEIAGTDFPIQRNLSPSSLVLCAMR